MKRIRRRSADNKKLKIDVAKKKKNRGEQEPALATIYYACINELYIKFLKISSSYPI